LATFALKLQRCNNDVDTGVYSKFSCFVARAELLIIPIRILTIEFYVKHHFYLFNATAALICYLFSSVSLTPIAEYGHHGLDLLTDSNLKESKGGKGGKKQQRQDFVEG